MGDGWDEAKSDEVLDLHEAFNERAAIFEYDARLPRAKAELEAFKIVGTLARYSRRWARGLRRRGARSRI